MKNATKIGCLFCTIVENNKNFLDKNIMEWYNQYVLISERKIISVTGLKPEVLGEVSDEELINAAKNGSSGAWEEIFFRYRHLVRPKKETKFLVGAEENDVMQERRLGLYSAVKEFDAEKCPHFAAFAKRCVDNRLSAAITAALRKKHLPLNSYVSLDKESDEKDGTSVFPVFTVSDNSRNPEDILIDRENKNDMEYKINKELSRLEVKVLSMHLEGWSYKEIANRLGKNTKSVDNAMQRIKRRFKNRKDVTDNGQQLY